MLASPPVSFIGANFGSVHPSDGAVPKTRMIMASGASGGLLNITLSTLPIGSSVEGGMGGGASGGAGGAGPLSVVAAGAACWLWLSDGFLLQATSSRDTAAATRTPRRTAFIGPIPSQAELFVRHK